MRVVQIDESFDYDKALTQHLIEQTAYSTTLTPALSR